MARDRLLERFSENLHVLFRYMKRNQWNESGTQEVTRTQWFILRNVWQQEACTVGQLAEWLEVRPSTMSQMLDRMELSGWISREPAAHDARTRIVRLTDAGRETVRKLKDARVEVLAGPFGALTEEEREALVALLEKVSRQTGCRPDGNRE